MCKKELFCRDFENCRDYSSCGTCETCESGHKPWIMMVHLYVLHKLYAIK